MNLAIIIDSTCDLGADELKSLKVQSVPLYVNFQGKMHRDWLDITPAAIIKGVSEGADLPTTSQPSPEDFARAYAAAETAGADTILVITITSELSGTFQSANIAKERAKAAVHVFDSRAASLGHGEMARTAARLRDAGASIDQILDALKVIRDTNFVIFTVGTMEYLQKGGRIGRASAFLGGLLNIKPILTLEDGKIAPLSRARGVRKAQQEMVDRFKAYAANLGGSPVVNLIHIQDESAAIGMRQALVDSGVQFQLAGVHEIGAVIGSHVGPATFGLYAHKAVG